MKKTLQNKLIISGSVKTFINFSHCYRFNIGSTAYTFEIPLGNEKNGADNFKLIGNISTDNFNDAKQEGIQILESLLDQISIFFNVPIESLTISDIRLERGSNLNIATSQRSVSVMGTIVINDSKMNDFIKNINFNNKQVVLRLFRKCRSDNSYISYWTIYDIMQILIGERSDIDKYLKKNYTKLKTVHNDFKNKDNSIFIAIRDSFSHKTTYLGVPLNIDLEIKKNIEEFRNIARNIILTKLNISI